jgi:uroporphyrin-III C-methyltransferase/precorrin-2 dehydrogenase/sirohydrochlorin ferrochelatase
MDYFPAFLRLDDKPVLLVGGGVVALRKLRLLARARARVTIVAPTVLPVIGEMLEGDARLRWMRRAFVDSDVRGKWLVVSATGDPAVEQRVAAVAGRNRVFVNAVDDANNCSLITPAIVDRSPLVVAVSSGGHAPTLARRVRADIERRLPARLGKLAELAGRWRHRVRDSLDDARTRLRFWERFLDSEAAANVIAGHHDVDAAIGAMLADSDAEVERSGRAWLVGAGPGDPELLTLKAHRLLQNADIVLYDRLVSEQVLELARRDARLIPVGKQPGCTANAQDDINALLVRLVAEGNRVCRLKGGDPFVFGRGGEEASALAKHGLSFDVVPGITAAAGCAAAAGISLTHRDAAQSVVLVTAHGRNSEDRLDWASLARDRQTLAFYMGVRRFPDIMQQLIAHGRAADTPIAIIERGTTPEQRVLRGTLGQLGILSEAHRIEAPAILLVGDVVALAPQNVQRAPGVESVSMASSETKSAIPVGTNG